MRIGLLTASVSRRAGGVLETVRGLGENLALYRDVDVLAIGLQDRDTKDDLGAWQGLSVRACPVWGAELIGYAPTLFSTVMAANLDVLHLHGLWKYPSIVSLRWAARTQMPLIVSPHGMLEPWAMRQSRWKKRIAGCLWEIRNLRRAACLHALCASEVEAIRGIGLRNPICVVPNAVDLPHEELKDPPSWRLTIPDEARILLFVGRLHRKKNLDGLLRAWALTTRSNRDQWWLIIAGWAEDGYETNLHELVRSLAIRRVVFAGPQYGDEKMATFRCADAFVLASHSEGLPVAVLEAWANRLPVIMTRQCNLPEGFGAGAAIEVSPKAEDIAAGIARLMDCSDQERLGMGRAGRTLVERDFGWPVITRRFMAVYLWLLDLAEIPDCVVMA